MAKRTPPSNGNTAQFPCQTRWVKAPLHAKRIENNWEVSMLKRSLVAVFLTVFMEAPAFPAEMTKIDATLASNPPIAVDRLV